MEIKFCGAARTVTGSSHLITLDDGYSILLDCGLYQGDRDRDKELNRKWYFKPKNVDSMILSHAHIDHSGRIPGLVKDGFDGRIHATHATRSLCSIMLMDSAKIQEREAQWANEKAKKKRKKKKAEFIEPIYGTKDVPPAMANFVGHGYNHWFQIRKGVRVLFRDQGHILGSASVTIEITEGKKVTTVGFTGDIGRPDRPILRDPVQMPPVDYMICESTYGDKEHESTPEQSSLFLEVVKEACCVKKGKLIIPAFSIGRTQEIVYMLDKLENQGLLPNIPVYVDSPLAVNATHIYGTHPECYDHSLQEYMLNDPDPFGFNSLTYITDVNQSKQLNHMKKPAIIISSSGMMEAGRIRHHLYNNITNPKSTFLIVGYCSPSSTGGQLKNGAKELRIFGETLPVNATVRVMHSFSAHADRKEMVDFMSNQNKLKKVFLVHGEYDPQKAFRSYLRKKNIDNVIIPELGETIRIGKAPKSKGGKGRKSNNVNKKDYPAKRKTLKEKKKAIAEIEAKSNPKAVIKSVTIKTKAKAPKKAKVTPKKKTVNTKSKTKVTSKKKSTPKNTKSISKKK